jgi:shikimate kinase
MMGCGKTTLGKAVAKWLDVPFYDLDELIAKRRKVSIRRIIETEGWDGFRDSEIIELKQLMNEAPGIVALGGGTLESAEAVKIIKDNGESIFIDVSTDQLANRIGLDTSRPLLKNCKSIEDVSKNLQSIWDSRVDTYKNCDYRLQINADELLEHSIGKIKVLINKIKLPEILKSQRTRIEPN